MRRGCEGEANDRHRSRPARSPVPSRSASAPPAGARTFAKIRFHADHVTLTVPKPPCRPTHGTTSCQWTLAVTENLGPVTGRATGTAGSLSVPYPAHYCGVIHAAAIVGPPMRKEVGHKTTIGGTCPTPAPNPPASPKRRVVAVQPQFGPPPSPPRTRATRNHRYRACLCSRSPGPDLGPAGHRDPVSGPRGLLSAKGGDRAGPARPPNSCSRSAVARVRALRRAFRQ